MNHDYEKKRSLFQIQSTKPLWNVPSGEITMTSYPVGNKNLVISETMYLRLKVTMESYQEVMVALSKSIMERRLKRPPAEKSRWRYIRLALKSRYLGNHVSQIKLLSQMKNIYLLFYVSDSRH